MKTTKLNTLGALLASAVVANAASVSWDGTSNTITENPTDGTNNNSSLDITQTNTFSTGGGFQSPASAAGAYTGGTGSPTSPGNADFFAAVNSSGSIASFTIFDGGASDLLGRMQHSSASTTTTMMFAWNFGGSDLESFGLTGFGAFGGSAQANVASSESRFLFQDSGGDWFISDAATDIADVTAASWNAYTPHAGGDGVIGAAATPGFTGVQHVGYYASIATNANGGGGIFATGFSAAAAVPEPSSSALLGLGALALIMRKRR